MQDGYTQVGAGDSDMRLAGEDLQHNRQTCTANGSSGRQSGGPMKEALDKELARHQEARNMRLQHLESHYKR